MGLKTTVDMGVGAACVPCSIHDRERPTRSPVRRPVAPRPQGRATWTGWSGTDGRERAAHAMTQERIGIRPRSGRCGWRP
jgi:hypothetical protein